MQNIFTVNVSGHVLQIVGRFDYCLLNSSNCSSNALAIVYVLYHFKGRLTAITFEFLALVLDVVFPS